MTIRQRAGWYIVSPGVNLALDPYRPDPEGARVYLPSAALAEQLQILGRVHAEGETPDSSPAPPLHWLGQGGVIEWENVTGADIAAGSPVDLGGVYAFALQDISDESAGRLALTGVWEMTLPEGLACFAGELICVAGDALSLEGVPVGVAVADSFSTPAGERVRVHLLPGGSGGGSGGGEGGGEGGEPNVIETVKVNGTALAVTAKAVNVTVPTAVSALTNDSGYLVADDIAGKADSADVYTRTEVNAAIAELRNRIDDAIAEYRRIEYLESQEKPNNLQYINTGIAPNQDTRIVMDVQILKDDSGYRLMGTQLEDGKKFRVGTFNGEQWLVRYAGEEFSHAPEDGGVTGRHTIELGQGEFIVDGVVIHDFGDVTFTATAPIHLFAINDRTLQDNAVARLWSCKIYQGDELVRDFVPCRHRFTRFAGLYDMVTKQQYGNMGTGEFIAGPDMEGGITMTEEQP